MCKRGGLLIGWDLKQARALMVRANCDKWSCAECAERKADRWKLRAQIGARKLLNEGYKLDFVTITSHEKLETFVATERVWRGAWKNLYAALKRKQPELEYFIVPEQHKDGRMHIHAIWNAGVSKRWIKDNARKRGLGYQADVGQITEWVSAVRYVTKYITKTKKMDAPPHFRRVRVSRGWPEIPAPNTEQSNLKWEFTRSEAVLLSWLAEAQEKRIALIDAKSGQAFDVDDVDFRTMD